MIVDDATLDHEYLPIDGLLTFTEASARLILGDDSPAISENRVRSTLYTFCSAIVVCECAGDFGDGCPAAVCPVPAALQARHRRRHLESHLGPPPDHLQRCGIGCAGVPVLGCEGPWH